MTRFDAQLKRRLQAEPIKVPDGYAERIDNLLNTLRTQAPICESSDAQSKVLSTNTTPQKQARSRRLIAAWAAALMLLVTTPLVAVSSPKLAHMTESVISYFSAPKEFKFLSKRAEYEKYNAAVGVSVEHSGITFTLDNIAVDDSYLNIFYTITSRDPIELAGDESKPLEWRYAWTSPTFWFKADGLFIKPPAQLDVEAYLVDECTLRGMQRLALLDDLADSFNLEIYTDQILGVAGPWHVAVTVDKSEVAVASTTVFPNLKATLTAGWWKGEIQTHKVTVKKVSISPFGSQIVLSERGDAPLTNFALRDDQGHYLPVIPGSTYSNKFAETENSFEFIPKSPDMQSLTLIPFSSVGDTELKYFDLTRPLPARLPVNAYGAYVLQKVYIDEEKMVAVFEQDGPVNIANFPVFPADAAGNPLNFTDYSDYTYDRTTGKITLTSYWKEGITPENLQQIKGLAYVACPALELNEADALTIELR